MKDFFISYNKADRQWAEWIAWQLEEAGYSIIIQAWDFRPGGNFILEMNQAAKESERTIAVLSPEFLKSMFTKPEWAAALVKDPTGKDRKLLPVRVKKCQPDGLLTAIGYIDLVVLEEQAAKIALLEGVKLERAKPDQAPIYPGPVERIIQAAPQFPGALPPIWNIPFQRNPNFTGRDQALAELRAGLTSDDSSSWKQALWGLGGVGKSQIAVEYAYRYKDDYRVVGWLRSEEHATLAADYASLAKYLALPQKDLKDQTAIIDAVRYWLEHNHDWLLIFDNAQNPKEIKDYLPRGGGGRVVITSRNPEWGCFAQKLEIKVFKRAESIKFLLKRTGQSDRETARALAEELGCLPLALEQAGAYISKNGMALSRYLEMFQKHRKKILERGEIADYPYTVATTWEISFSNIVEKWPAGAHLLNLCAYLAPDEIPRSLLLQGANLLPEDLASAMKDEVEFEDAFSALRGYSLISNSEGSDLFSIHRLVQAVIRDKTEEDTKIRWATSALNLLNNAFAFDHDDVQTWDKCVQILPHALVAAGHARDLNIDPKLNGSLLGSIGLYLWERAEFLQAKSALQRALEIKEKVYGKEHPSVAIDLTNLGIVLKDLGDFEGAKKIYERALEINEKAYGKDHPKTANVRNILESLDI